MSGKGQRQSRYRQQGFTLVEVLVALVMIALVGVSVQQRLGQFLDQRALLQDRQEAHWVAWNQSMAAYRELFWGESSQQPHRSDRAIRLLGRDWYALRESQSTLVGSLFRLQLSVFALPPEIGERPPSAASLVLYLGNEQ